jgi:hypothetical protein
MNCLSIPGRSKLDVRSRLPSKYEQMKLMVAGANLFGSEDCTEMVA